MPRANRYFLPGYIWHITHRCHKKEFLLKFARDRQRWITWLFEAKKRFGLSVLNYVVTSNHIHLLVRDTGDGVIPRSMQLIAGRTAQEYNHRKQRKGAFWEDRYHATAIATDSHFLKCLVYIDMNMVRAGVVTHPSSWPHGGYQEIHQPRNRYRIIDLPGLLEITGCKDIQVLQQQHGQWLCDELKINHSKRDMSWTESLAVGSEPFVYEIKALLGIRAENRKIVMSGEKHILRETRAHYNAHLDTENSTLSNDNCFIWNDL